jgi:hypothetical protein
MFNNKANLLKAESLPPWAHILFLIFAIRVILKLFAIFVGENIF